MRVLAVEAPLLHAASLQVLRRRLASAIGSRNLAAMVDRAAAGRLVALGASNLTLGIGHLIDRARRRAGGPVEVLAALGHGRSYGIDSRLFARTLPGIDGCGLWPALAALPPAPTTALVMDVGNDLLYGVEVAQILGWVDAALQRLRPLAGQLVLARLPLASLQRLGRLRFWLFRRLLFPRCKASLPELRDAALRLDAGLGGLAQRYGAAAVELPRQWYGVDPVHIRGSCWPAASGVLLADAGPSPPPQAARLRQRLRLWRAPEALRWRRGVAQQAAQPSLRLEDGSAVSFF